MKENKLVDLSMEFAAEIIEPSPDWTVVSYKSWNGKSDIYGLF